MANKKSINFGNSFNPPPGGSPPPTVGASKTPPGKTYTAASFTDIPYATRSPAQKLDLYLPATGDKPYPVLLWFHGGGWFLGDKGEDIAVFAEPFLDRGYAVASANYRLSREAVFPAQIHDAKAVVRWLRGHAAEYDLDPGKIIAAGASAGGHLAALLGTSAGIAALEDPTLGNPDQDSRVDAVVEWYGPTDFLAMDTQHVALGQEGYHDTPDSPEANLMGGQLCTLPEKCRAANPITYIREDCPPFYIQHGKTDIAVPYLQSSVLAEALEKVIGKDKVKLVLVDEAGHLDPAHMSPPYVKQIAAFLEQCLEIR